MHPANLVATLIIGALLLGVIGGAMWGYPQYRVYSQTMRGKAALAEAEQDRQIRIKEAEADLQAAKLLNQAEVERAKGVAEANKIVADGLGGPEGYLRYLYIQSLAQRNGDTIYIPTEAGLPILEAGQR